MKQLVIGMGQIGTAIQSVLGCDGQDVEIKYTGQYDVLHICFPYSDRFIELVENYKLLYKANLVIIHSTVPIGTSEKLGSVSSPCRGIHPNLKEGIETFDKFFGGEQAEEASKLFLDKIGGRCIWTKDSKSVEAMKLWETTQYGFNIILEKEIYKYCQENNLEYDLVYTKSNETYNLGYQRLGHPEYKKYVLKHHEGKIGGHCVIPNLKLLGGFISKTIEDYNNLL